MLGLNHLSTIVSMNNLTEILQRKYEAAEEMYQQVVDLRQKVLGPEQPDSLWMFRCSNFGAISA